MRHGRAGTPVLGSSSNIVSLRLGDGVLDAAEATRRGSKRAAMKLGHRMAVRFVAKRENECHTRACLGK